MSGKLPAFRLFDALSGDVRSALEKEISVKTFAKDDTIWRAGDAPDAVYFVIEGGAYGVTYAQDGKMHVTVIKTPGELVGHPACITGIPRTEDMLAYGDSTLARLGRDAFLDLFGRVPSLAQYLHRNMAYDLCEKIMISSARTLLTARGLAAFDLLRRQALLEDMDVPLPPQKIWAATLGLTRETLSRGLSTLVKDKTIVIEGNLITICDLESLRQAGTP